MFIAKVTHSTLTDRNVAEQFESAQDAWYHIMDCLDDDQDSIYDALQKEGKELSAILKSPDYVAYRDAKDEALELHWDRAGSVMVPVGTVQEGDGIVYGVIESGSPTPAVSDSTDAVVEETQPV